MTTSICLPLTARIQVAVKVIRIKDGNRRDSSVASNDGESGPRAPCAPLGSPITRDVAAANPHCFVNSSEQLVKQSYC